MEARVQQDTVPRQEHIAGETSKAPRGLRYGEYRQSPPQLSVHYRGSFSIARRENAVGRGSNDISAHRFQGHKVKYERFARRYEGNLHAGTLASDDRRTIHPVESRERSARERSDGHREQQEREGFPGVFIGAHDSKDAESDGAHPPLSTSRSMPHPSEDLLFANCKTRTPRPERPEEGSNHGTEHAQSMVPGREKAGSNADVSGPIESEFLVRRCLRSFGHGLQGTVSGIWISSKRGGSREHWRRTGGRAPGEGYPPCP